MKSKLLLLSCIVALLGGYVWGYYKYDAITCELRTEVSQLQEDRYFLEDAVLDLERKNDNVIEYMRTRFNMSDADINYAQEWRK